MTAIQNPKTNKTEPYVGMAEIHTVKRIAFDVDGTLIKKTDNGDVPRYEIIALARLFIDLGHTVFVWSGGGEDYARHWAEKLDLLPHVRILPKRGDAFAIDIAFDDHQTKLALVDVIV